MSDASLTNQSAPNTSLEEAWQSLSQLKDRRSAVTLFRGRWKAALLFGVLSVLLIGCGGTETLMFRGGPARTGVYDDPGPEAPIRTKWRFRTESAVSSSPAVSGGTIYVESFNGTLRVDLLNREIFGHHPEAKVLSEQYNTERPHSALNYQTPVEFAA